MEEVGVEGHQGQEVEEVGEPQNLGVEAEVAAHPSLVEVAEGEEPLLDQEE